MDKRFRSVKSAVCRTNTAINIHQVCRACGVERSLIVSMVEYGIVEMGADEMFDSANVRRLIKAARLYRDLNVNVQGIAVILDLLDELEAMRARVATLERTFETS